MRIKGENELLLYQILNKAYPNQWIGEHRGLEAIGIDKNGKEYRRRFRFDAANPALKIAIEIEGGVWMGKGHTGGLHYQQDMEKYNLAVLEGWKVLRYTPETLRNNPYKLIRDVRMLCGASDDPNSTQIDLTGVKQSKIEQVQVRLG